MKRKQVILWVLFGLILSATFALLVTDKRLLAQGSCGGITVVDADSCQTETMVESSALMTAVGNVAPRFILNYVDSWQIITVEPAPAALTTAISAVDERMILNYADSKNIILVSYPAQLLNDTTDPSVVGSPVVGTVTSTSAEMTWITDEFTTSSVNYGTTAGNYTQNESDGLYVTNHSVTLTGLTTNSTYYLRVGGSDQAGNNYQSAELSFTVGTEERYLYMPLISR